MLSAPLLLLLSHENRVASHMNKSLGWLGLLLKESCRVSQAGACSHREFCLWCVEVAHLLSRSTVLEGKGMSCWLKAKH